MDMSSLGVGNSLEDLESETIDQKPEFRWGGLLKLNTLYPPSGIESSNTNVT